ncbi:Bax inhibitor-1/YccA family protein [Marinicella rhabdoformis]|uniref:Bax inhibitor-1/YccA family protein n=1 Tax=Marinicella rhabdoformis TaxID=2580566 RepID=UPI0012AEDC81|nr:Bax inhibitor-1 family protein [Marinicella rhabdoformis]
MSYVSELTAEEIKEFPQGVNKFIAEAYGYLLLSLFGIFVLGLFSYNFFPDALKWPLLFADIAIWVACGWFGWRNPIKIVMPLFTVITGLFLGLVAHEKPDVFFTASVMTIVGFVGLSSYVWGTKKDFSFLLGILNMAFYIIIGAMLVSIFIDIPFFTLFISGLGVLAFSGWILYDTSQIILHHDEQDSSAIAGFELLIDIVGLHAHLLSLLDSLGFGDD